MKKITFILLAVFSLSAFNLMAGEDEDDRRRRRRGRSGGNGFEVGLNPFGYIFGNYNAMAGYHLSESTSLFAEVAYQRYKYVQTGLDTNFNVYTEDIIYSGFSIAPEFRFYFGPDYGNDRWFAGLYLKARFLSTSGQPYVGVNEDDEFVPYDTKSFSVIPGVTVGYEWVTNSGFTITFWTGAGYAVVYNEKTNPEFTPSSDPFWTGFSTVVSTINKLDGRGGITLAYRFN